MRRVVFCTCLIGLVLAFFVCTPHKALSKPRPATQGRFFLRTGPHSMADQAMRKMEWPGKQWMMARRGRGGDDRGGIFNRPGRDNDQMWRERYREWESLPPERKRLLRERMKEWKCLSPRERALMRKRYEQWKNLSPEEQIWIRNQLRRWKELTPQEREMIRERFLR